jgi:hypothetical protein
VAQGSDRHHQANSTRGKSVLEMLACQQKINFSAYRPYQRRRPIFVRRARLPAKAKAAQAQPSENSHLVRHFDTVP